MVQVDVCKHRTVAINNLTCHPLYVSVSSGNKQKSRRRFNRGNTTINHTDTKSHTVILQHIKSAESQVRADILNVGRSPAAIRIFSLLLLLFRRGRFLKFMQEEEEGEHTDAKRAEACTKLHNLPSSCLHFTKQPEQTHLRVITFHFNHLK